MYENQPLTRLFLAVYYIATSVIASKYDLFALSGLCPLARV
jgi:hypothetical protein